MQTITKIQWANLQGRAVAHLLASVVNEYGHEINCGSMMERLNHLDKLMREPGGCEIYQHATLRVASWPKQIYLCRNDTKHIWWLETALSAIFWHGRTPTCDLAILQPREYWTTADPNTLAFDKDLYANG